MNIQFPHSYDEDQSPGLYPDPPRLFAQSSGSEQSQSTIRPIPYDPARLQRFEEQSPPSASSSPPSTVVPFAAPTPPLPSATLSGAYNPAHLHGPLLVPTAYNVQNPFVPQSRPAYAGRTQRMDAFQSAMRAGSLREERAQSAGRVTPGVDDTPFLQWALDAMTRDNRSSSRLSGMSNDLPSLAVPPNAFEADDLPVAPSPVHQREVYVPAGTPGHIALTMNAPRMQPDSSMARTDTHGRDILPDRLMALQPLPPEQPQPFDPAMLPGPRRPKKPLFEMVPLPDEYISPIKFPRLTFKPRILRPFWMITFMILLALMITAIIVTIILSGRRTMLTTYSGTIYSEQYFLFRILPQFMGGVFLLWAQSITMASFRLSPFARMADIHPDVRDGALFQRMYPKSFLWPDLVGPWQLRAGTVATWLLNFTLPLQSALFTVTFTDGAWRWSVVRGAAWTLISLYFLYILGLVIMILYWHGRRTGVMWDIRSIADIIPMVYDSNIRHEYVGSDKKKGSDFLHHLQMRNLDRLSYWQVPNASEKEPFVYGIAVGKRDVNKGPWDRSRYDEWIEGWGADNAPIHQEDWAVSGVPWIRYRYQPWCMRNIPVYSFAVVGFALLIALLAVSFAHQTRLTQGFDPRVAARPDGGAFSPANFLYSFLPSLLGTILFLMFQALDLTFRIYKPWGELQQTGGGTAARSILADYAACLPFEATFRALYNHHWRSAFLSFLASIFIFIPILAGGVFMALSVTQTSEVRMFPNMAVYGVLLGLLCLMAIALVVIIPFRRQFRLSHPVLCPAEVISYCYNKKLSRDPVWRFVRSRRELKMKLGTHSEKLDNSRFVLDSGPRHDKALNIRRVGRYTEKPFDSVV